MRDKQFPGAITTTGSRDSGQPLRGFGNDEDLSFRAERLQPSLESTSSALVDKNCFVAHKLQMRTIKRTSKAKPFDAAEYLDSPEMIAAYINEALESEDASAIAVAIGTVARARGMSAVAEKAGLSRENLYRALGGEARPEFGTVIKVLHALGIDLVAQPQGSKAA